MNVKTTCVIVELEDGQFHQIVLSREQETWVLACVQSLFKGPIHVYDHTLALERVQ